MNDVRSISIETSGPAASISIGLGDRLLAEQDFPASIGHAGSLIPFTDELCRSVGWRPTDLNECYISIGPGSFTGLRVAVAFARHLALATGARLVAVPSLEAIAWNLVQGHDGKNVAVFVPARKEMVFAALFRIEEGRVQTLRGPEIAPPAAFLEQAPRPVIVSGSGCTDYIDLIRSQGAELAGESAWMPHARGVFTLGRLRASAGLFSAPASLVPLYVRRPEAEELWEKRHQAGNSTEQAG